jgi:hypothetical protein
LSPYNIQRLPRSVTALCGPLTISGPDHTGILMPAQLQPVQPLHYPRIAGWLDSLAATQRWAGPGVAFPLLPEAFAQTLELA